MTEGYSPVPYKEVRWTKAWHRLGTGELAVDTAVSIVRYGTVNVSEELFDQMMKDLGFVKVVD